MHISDKVFLTVLSLLSIVAICATAYIFLVQKNYDFIIETPCDPSVTTCFSRDCSTGECPANELEQYRVFSVRAGDFSTCKDASCARECPAGTIPCVEIVCGESEEDVCAESPTTPSQ